MERPILILRYTWKYKNIKMTLMEFGYLSNTVSRGRIYFIVPCVPANLNAKHDIDLV